MRQLFKIDESEKKRILEMHENATKKNYLMEQSSNRTCFSPQDAIMNEMVQKDPNLCTKLNGNEEFSVGEYYFKETNTGTGKKWNVYQLNADFIPYLSFDIEGKASSTSANKTGGNLFVRSESLTRIQAPGADALTYLRENSLTVDNVLTRLINFAKEKNLDEVTFTAYMTNFLNSNPTAKEGFTNVVNSATDEKIKNNQFIRSLISA